MKKLVCVILGLVLCACVTGTPNVKPTVAEPQKVEIAIKGVDAVTVAETPSGSSGESLDERRFQLEREKWDYEVSEKHRAWLKNRLSSFCDYEADPPVFTLYSHISMGDWRAMENDFRILWDLGHRKIIMSTFSGGGCAFSGLGIADLITEWRNKGMTIEGRANGLIASAAVPIFAACRPRYAGPSTMFMVHEASIFKFFTSESHSDIISQKKMMDDMRDRYVEFLERNSSVDADTWALMLKETTWFSADEAHKWGLVDEVR